MSEWQPIESAPKDGSQCVVCGDNDSHDWAIYIAKFTTEGKWQGWQTYDGCDLMPTHWLPLPELPEAPE